MAEIRCPQPLDGIEELAERYAGFLLDQFGVLHDGRRVFEGVLEALAHLQERDRLVLILSNSGRRAEANETRLADLGVPRELYTALLSSGEVAWIGLKEREGAFADLGRRCLFYSRGGDRSAIEGLDLAVVRGAATADFVFLSGIDPDPASQEAARQELEVARKRGLPLICTNPDLVSLDGPRRTPGPGAFASTYEEAGGLVRWVGKPWPLIYETALARLALPASQIVAVGDSLEHDVRGAAGAGIDSALVLSGVHTDLVRDRPGWETVIERVLAAGAPHPRWVLERFAPADPAR